MVYMLLMCLFLDICEYNGVEGAFKNVSAALAFVKESMKAGLHNLFNKRKIITSGEYTV